MCNENEGSCKGNWSFSVGLHIDNYEKIVYKAWRKKFGRLISFTEIEKLQIHSRFDILFEDFKESDLNVDFVTGQWNFDQSEVEFKCYQICQTITLLCSKSHFVALWKWVKFD